MLPELFTCHGDMAGIMVTVVLGENVLMMFPESFGWKIWTLFDKFLSLWMYGERHVCFCHLLKQKQLFLHKIILGFVPGKEILISTLINTKQFLCNTHLVHFLIMMPMASWSL